VPESREKVNVEGDNVDLDDQSVYAVLSMDQFMLLRTENDYSISVMQQLETAASVITQQVCADETI